MKIYNKYVDEIKTFYLDWSVFLNDANNGLPDTISSASWMVQTGLNKIDDYIIGNKTYLRVSGGTDGAIYTCWCILNLTSGTDTPKRGLKIKLNSDYS